MTRSARRTLAAALATATALAALFPVFEGAHWFWPVLGPVGVVATTGLLTRALRVPRVLQPLLAAVAVATYLVVVFAHGTLDSGVPGQQTVDALRELAERGSRDIDTYAPPVPPTWGIVLIASAGVGLVALLVDLLAVVLGRVAVAGLPLLALFVVPSAVLPGGLGGVPFAVGATGWLLLLLEEGSERVAGWGGPMRAALPGARPTDESSLGRVGRRIGVAAVGLAVVIPSFVPGLDHRLVGNGSGAGTGTGDGGPSQATTYNPLTTLQEQLTLPTPRQLLVYETDDPSPDYLRMTTLDTYTGSGWASSKLEADRDRAKVQKGVPRPPGEDEGAPHRSVQTTVAIDGGSLAVHWLPAPYGPRQVQVEGTWLWDPRSQTVFSASRTTKGLKPYAVRSERVLPDRDRLLASADAPVDPSVEQRYQTSLRVAPPVVVLTQRITRAAETPYDRAVAIQRYFTDLRNGFVYDTNPSQPRPGQDPLQAFLEGKHGFCEQYATAMAVMLRVAGLPSRVAVGFTSGTKVPGRDRVWSVTTSDAHAWPEAWFPGTGWVRFEPTPAAHGASTPDYSLPAALITPEPGSPEASASPTPTPSGNAFPRGFKDPDTLLRDAPDATGPGSTGSSPTGWLLPAVLLLAVLAAVPWTTAELRRRQRAGRGDPLVAWQQVQEDAADVGLVWRDADSPRAAADRLRPAVGAAAGALDRLATAAELARYAPAGRARSEGLAQDGSEVRRALLASVPRAVRWRAVVLAPSTVRWAGRAVGDRVADVLDASDRFVGAVLAPARKVLRLRS